MLILAPEDFAQVGLEQLRITSEDRDANRLLGQLWEAVKMSTSRTDIVD